MDQDSHNTDQLADGIEARADHADQTEFEWEEAHGEYAVTGAYGLSPADILDELQAQGFPITGEAIELLLDRMEATGVTPTKQVGDLAQVSTGVSGAEAVVVGLMEWSIKWKRKTVDSTTTDYAGYAGKLASTADWSATAKFAYIDGDVSQTAQRATINTLQTTSQRYNFFNSPSTGRDSYYGNAWLTGIDLSTGVGKIFGMDVTLEGDGPLYIAPQIAQGTGTGVPAVIAEN